MTPLIILLYTLFASSFTMGKLLSTHTSPIFLTAIRMILGGFILLLYQIITASHRTVTIKRSDLWALFQIMLFGVYFNYILRFWALAYLPSFKTCFLFNFSPFFSSFYSYFAFNEKLSKQQWIGLLIGFCGMIPVLISNTNEIDLPEKFFISLPEVAVLISVAMHSYSWILVRHLVKHRSYNPTFINSTTMTVGGLLALITSFALEVVPPLENSATFIGWLLFVVLVSNVFCHNLYGYLLKTYTATFLSFCAFLTPILAAILGSVFLNEKIGPSFYLSVVVVFIGLYLFYKHEIDQIKKQVLLSAE
jgi:drug/metabolite transporter (DMT)-like permease